MKAKKPTLEDLLERVERLRASYDPKVMLYGGVAEMLANDYSLDQIADHFELPVERVREIGWELIRSGEFDDLVDF